MKKISIIVAIAKNFAIGKDNKLLWHISADMKRFKKLTEGHQVIMGKLTYESLPVRPLPNRQNIIISDNLQDSFEGCITVHSIQEAVELCSEEEESFIIGGGSIYRQFLPLSNKLYLTIVDKDFDADTFLKIDLSQWHMIDKEDHGPDDKNNFSYSFVTYEK
jgi:dihydrofolate reductase